MRIGEVITTLPTTGEHHKSMDKLTTDAAELLITASTIPNLFVVNYSDLNSHTQDASFEAAWKLAIEEHATSSSLFLSILIKPFFSVNQSIGEFVISHPRDEMLALLASLVLLQSTTKLNHACLSKSIHKQVAKQQNAACSLPQSLFPILHSTPTFEKILKQYCEEIKKALPRTPNKPSRSLSTSEFTFTRKSSFIR